LLRGTDNLSSYFNILSPGENEVAMFIGSTSGNQYEGTLPKSGPYKILQGWERDWC
jgi:hypothetical protein